MSLNKQVAKSAVWMVGLRTSIKLIGFVSTIFLARLLTPEDFGLVAIIMSFFALMQILGDFGFDTVLIQKQDSTTADYNTAWSFNFSFGLFACAVVAASSTIVADFYGKQELQPIMLVLSLLFLINGTQNIGVVDFRKNLTFEKEFKFQILPKIISFFCTLGLAFWLRNYWALVIGTLVWKGCITINSYLLHSFRPKLTFVAWKELFNFSKWLMINNLFYFINTRSPEMIIGKIISPQASGFFTIAQEISTMSTTELASNVNRATYPGYSKISHDPQLLKDMYLTVMASISILVVPAGVGVASIAGVLVPVVLGNQWLESIVLIKYLAISGTLMAVNSNTGYVFLAMGLPKISSIMGLLRIVVFLPMLLWFSFAFGLEGAALAVFLTTVVMFAFSNILIYSKLKITAFQLLSVHLRPVLSSFIMFLFIYFAQPYFADFYQGPGIMFLLSCVVLGAVVYIGFILLFWWLSGFADGPEKNVINLVISKFHHLNEIL